MIIYLYKEKSRIGIGFKDAEIYLFNDKNECIEAKESELHDLLADYLIKILNSPEPKEL